MEFIPGDDLEELIKSRASRYTFEDILDWMDQILGILTYLHGHKPPVIHRDIKPANLKLMSQGRIMLLDFGIAKNTPKTYLQASTPQYAPPEQIYSLGTEPRSDLFALGATFYHLLTDRPPEHASGRFDTVHQGYPDPLRPPRHLNPRVPEAISAFIMHALALKKEDRPASAAAMRADLRAIQEAARTVNTDPNPRPRRPTGVRLLHTFEGWEAKFAPDGQTLATWRVEQGKEWAKLWRVADGKLLHTLQGGFPKFAPDGQTLITKGGVKGSLWTKLWRVADGRLLHTVEGDFYQFFDQFAPDGQTLATEGGVKGSLWTKLWRVADGRLLHTFERVDEQGSEWTKLWRVADGRLLHTFEGLHQKFAPDGQTLITWGGEQGSRWTKLWRVEYE
jgi:hypothetical protein